MQHQNIRRVVFITESEELDSQEDFIQYIQDNKGSMLSSHKCEEGFVCLVHFEEPSEFIELAEGPESVEQAAPPETPPDQHSSASQHPLEP